MENHWYSLLTFGLSGGRFGWVCKRPWIRCAKNHLFSWTVDADRSEAGKRRKSPCFCSSNWKHLFMNRRGYGFRKKKFFTVISAFAWLTIIPNWFFVQKRIYDREWWKSIFTVRRTNRNINEKNGKPWDCLSWFAVILFPIFKNVLHSFIDCNIHHAINKSENLFFKNGFFFFLLPVGSSAWFIYLIGGEAFQMHQSGIVRKRVSIYHKRYSFQLVCVLLICTKSLLRLCNK